MNRDLTSYRKSYDKLVLDETTVPSSPFQLFSDWFKEVEAVGGVEEANAMTLTTTDQDGYPKGRIVLLKHYDDQGFVFYTNYTSEKGKAMQYNTKVCLSFFWPNLERQVIIKGTVAKLSEADSTAYFHSRPRGSQLGAWASQQSSIITDRNVLENALADLEKQYPEGTTIPKPSFWGGYCVTPLTFEFWQGRPNRLHDRIRYQSMQTDNWDIERLSP